MKTSLLLAAFQSAEACFGFALCRSTRSSTTCLGCKEQATAKKRSAKPPNQKMLKMKTNQNSFSLDMAPGNAKLCTGKTLPALEVRRIVPAILAKTAYVHNFLTSRLRFSISIHPVWGIAIRTHLIYTSTSQVADGATLHIQVLGLSNLNPKMKLPI